MGKTIRKALIPTVALLTAAIFPLGVPAHAQSPPHVFVGEARLDGAIVPDGTVITAVVNGQSLPRAETTVREGKFTLVVEQSEALKGEVPAIGFSVGDYLAQQTYSWQMGEIKAVALTASRDLPTISAEVNPQLPDRLIRGGETILTVKANTGFYKATRGEVKVSLDPEVFSADLDSASLLSGRTQRAFMERGQILGGWTYHAPTSTDAHWGELFTLPLRVKDSAPTGTTSLVIEVQLFGSDGETFPLEPDQFHHEIAVASLASDLNEDGAVDFADLAVLGSVWGKNQGEPGFHPDFDLDGDGSIWIGDLVMLLQSYGR